MIDLSKNNSLSLSLSLSRRKRNAEGLRDICLNCIYTASDYVQDGLIAMWDGIENNGFGKHSDTIETWNDLINGNTLSTTDFLLYKWQDGGLHYDGYSSANATGMIGSLVSGLKFVEIVLKQESDAQSQGILWVANGFSSGSSMMLWSYMSGSAITYNYVTSQSYEKGTFIKGEKAQYSFNCEDASNKALYKNAEAVTILNSADGWGSGSLSNNLWMFKQNSYANGGNITIYAVRIYNRVLKERERRANYNLDKIRFDLN